MTSQALGQLISIILVKYANWDNITAMTASNAITVLLGDFLNDYWIYISTICLIYVLFNVLLNRFGQSYYVNKLKMYLSKSNAYSTLLVDTISINRFACYIRHFPENFQTPVEISERPGDDTYIVVPGQKVIWTDKKLDYYGSIESYLEKYITKDGNISYRPCLRILTQRNPGTIESFIESIRDRYRTIVEKKKYWYRVLNNNSGHLIATWNQLFTETSDADLLYKKYIRSFFSPHRDRIWTWAKRVEYDPEYFLSRGMIPHMHLLLHGPSGTGKSSLAYRLARALKRHIVTIDLSLMLDDRQEINTHLYNLEINMHRIMASEAIYVFDEFDIVIDELLRREKLSRKRDELFLTMGPNRDMRRSEVELRSNGDDEEKSRDTSRDTSRNLQSITKRHFSLKDLLEIFQGPVNSYGSIYIATTNHYERLQKAIPELFRAGRMTPILIDYLDWASFNELCQYYFSKTWSGPQFSIKIPTSEIIEMAMDSLMYSESSRESSSEFSKEYSTGSCNETVCGTSEGNLNSPGQNKNKAWDIFVRKITEKTMIV
jgi:adenylate kinase family enzyme